MKMARSQKLLVGKLFLRKVRLWQWFHLTIVFRIFTASQTTLSGSEGACPMPKSIYIYIYIYIARYATVYKCSVKPPPIDFTR
jgi:hypothetical protein